MTDKPLLKNTDVIVFIKSLQRLLADNSFIYFQYYLGTPRKIKRILNAMIMLNIFDRVGSFKDRVNEELIYLLLIYIYHPEIFRDIYAHETGEKRGYFSIISSYDITLLNTFDEKNTFRERDEVKQINSKYFRKYLKSVNSPGARFLLERLFDVEKRFGDRDSKDHTQLDKDHLSRWACFNGSVGTPSNLEHYLKFITDTSFTPNIGTQRGVYVDLVESFRKGKKFSEILNDPIFTEDLDVRLVNFFDVFFDQVNGFGYEIKVEYLEEMIKEIISSRSKLAYYKMSNPAQEDDFFERGYRKNIDFKIIKILDLAHYLFKDSAEYREWIKKMIFGKDSIIVQIASDTNENPVLNLNDLLSLRLYMNIDRGGSLFRVADALHDLAVTGKRNDTKGRTYDFEFLKNEMRAISQFCYENIKKHILKSDTSVFSLVEDLSLSDIDPNYNKEGEYDQERILILKERLLSFSLYQISNKKYTDSGINIGFFDLEGEKDNSEINLDFTKYILSCFDKNPSHFWWYAAISSAINTDSFREKKYIYSTDSLFDVIDYEMFTNYTKNNESTLRKALPKEKLSIRSKVIDFSNSEEKLKLEEFFQKILNKESI